MKNRVFATFSALTLLTAAAAFGQINAGLDANIPFEFHAGGIFPAGHYELRSGITPGVLSIRCFECKATALVMASPVESGKTPETGSLVFHQYNGAYFLSKVWTGGSAKGRELSPSKTERELARNGSPGQSVVVVAGTGRR